MTQQRQEITEAVDGGQSYKSNVFIAIRPASILPNVIELSYYSNTMLLHYVLNSVIGKIPNAIDELFDFVTKSVNIFSDRFVC